MKEEVKIKVLAYIYAALEVVLYGSVFYVVAITSPPAAFIATASVLLRYIMRWHARKAYRKRTEMFLMSMGLDPMDNISPSKEDN